MLPTSEFAPVYPGVLRSLEASGNASGNATTTKALTPFGSKEVLDDTLLNVLSFLIVLVAAHPLGTLFPRFLKLPLITGYLLVGVVTGPFVANLLTTTTVQLLASSINAMALSFISFQAGQEIYLPELKPQIKGILQLLVVLYLTAMVLLTFVMTVGAGPFFYGSFDTSCKLAIALLFGSIAVLGSPATVMAIKIELNSVGPFTNLMLGATMTAEFVVLISFSIARVVSSVYCAKLAITFGNLMFTMGIVFSNILVGVLIGLLILAIFMIPGGPDHGHHDAVPHNHVDDNGDVVVVMQEPSHHHKQSGSFFGSLYFKGFVWLFMGYIFYISTTAISEATIAAFGHVWDVKFEPLLVLMVGSCLAGHHSKIRHDMHVILDASAPFVFLPFFVMTGAGLKLNQVANAIPLMSLFVSLRYAAIFLACYSAGRFLLKLPPHQYNNLWLTMTPQAGVALGLANEIKSLSKDAWASEFAATIVAAVVVNQIVGPVLCAMGLNRAGESQVNGKKADSKTPGAPDDGDLESALPKSGMPDIGTAGLLGGGPNEPLMPIRRAVVVGDDEIACELALQLALHGADVAMPSLNDGKAAEWDAMLDHIRSAYLRGDAAENVVDLRPAVRRPNEDPAARVRAAMTERQNDLVLFTVDSDRVLEYVRLIHTTGGRKPRLVAFFEGSSHLEQLRNRGVICVQSTVALSNLGIRLALMDQSTAASIVGTETSTSNERQWLTGGGLRVPPAGSNPAELQRALLHRRRVLQRNIQTTRHLQSVMNPQQTGGVQYGVAPQRVSMFGRSSYVEFMGTGRGTTARGNFVVSNEVFIMGGGVNGEGAFEDGPLDDSDEIYTGSARSGPVYVANNSSPAAERKRAGMLRKMASKDERSLHKGMRGNHRS